MADLSAWWRYAPEAIVATAAESATADRVTISDLAVPSRALMQRAGAAVAALVIRMLAGREDAGVAVFCGGGNNGGDGWVVARALAAAGVRVRVDEVVAARSPDCRAERALALPVVLRSREFGGEAVVVDAILGTGASGRARGGVRAGLERLAAARASGARVVAVDVPSGLDATSGDRNDAVAAHETVSLGSVKRGQLLARDLCGRIAVVDIGLASTAWAGVSPPMRLADARLARLAAPALPVTAHKGTRRRLAIVGGAAGMAGAVVLATRASLATGIGMTRALVHADSVPVLQAAVPEATCAPWPSTDAATRRKLVDWAHALVVGPGLGQGPGVREFLERLLGAWGGAVVLDADALNAFEGDAKSLAALLHGKPAAVTPHAVEFARLAGGTVDDVLARPFEAARELASRLGAVVLLKGVPTVVAAPRGKCIVSATGSAALATAGSGDVLAGIAGAMLAQNADSPLEAVAAAAWSHGRAGELASARGTRGVVLDGVIAALPRVWEEPLPQPSPLALIELPDPSFSGGADSGG